MDAQASGAQRVVELLRSRGVRTIFTLSGNQVLPLYDVLFDAEVRLLSTRHEAAAVHMADAWGQLTGTAGVALVTAGPGHSNALTALGVARGNESPVVLLSGATEATARGSGAFQDLPQPELATLVAKRAVSADDPATAGDLVARAFTFAEAPIPGPVSVSLPYDTQTGPALPGPAPRGSATLEGDGAPTSAGDNWRVLLEILGGAQAPVLLGSPWVARTEAFRAAAAHLGCPAFALESARAGSDPYLFGSEAAFARADLLLLLAPWDYTARTEAILRRRECGIVQVWPAAPATSLPPGVRYLAGQPHHALQAVLALPPRGSQSAREAVMQEQEASRATVVQATYETPHDGVHPLHLAEAVRRRLGDGDVVSIDGGEFCQWIRLGLAWGPCRTLINGKFGPIGTAVPHALGARVAVGEAPTVLGFAGDGGFGYHALEIETAAREQLPVILFVGTDGKWGAEWHLQRRRYGEHRVIGSALSVCHYEELARGLGGVGLLLERDEEIEATLDAAWRAMRDGRTVLVNVMAAPLPSPAALH
jgi:acetolactate synthase-1/2/3 large subunit